MILSGSVFEGLLDAHQADFSVMTHQGVPPLGSGVLITDLQSAQFARQEQGASFLEGDGCLRRIRTGGEFWNHFDDFGAFGDIAKELFQNGGIQEGFLQIRQWWMGRFVFSGHFKVSVRFGIMRMAFLGAGQRS
jgi:hypothetical protein